VLLGTWKQKELRIRTGCTFQLVCHCLRSLTTKKHLGPFRNRKKPHHPLLGFNDPAFPFWEIDAQRLRKTPHNIKNHRVPFGLPTRFSIVLLIIFLCIGLCLPVLRISTIRALKSPQE
jgi:hypothetical protein